MREGEEIEGWTLLEVALDFIVVERDGQEEILEPAFDVQTSPVNGAHRDKTKQETRCTCSMFVKFYKNFLTLAPSIRASNYADFCRNGTACR